MRPHPPGYHKDEDAEERCYACSAPEKFDATPEDEQFVRQLIAEGWKSTSNRYQRVSRVNVPLFYNAMTFSDEVPTWLREEMRRYYDLAIRFGSRGNEEKVEHRALTVAQYRLFKKLGGGTA